MNNMSGPASLARSLTTRMNRKKSVTDGVGSAGGLGRAFSLRRQEKPPMRPEISLPIELVSATNPLAFNAPDLPHSNVDSSSPLPAPKQLNAFASSNSLRSDGSTPALSSATSTTFTFSGISTPTEELAESQIQDLQNRLAAASEASADAPSSPQSQKSFSSNKARSPLSDTPAPAVPKRAPSHTKKTHQALARSRSISRARETADMAASTAEDSNRKSSSSSRHLSAHAAKDTLTARSSADMFSARNHTTSIDTNHPFGAELAKLTEVAEEFSPRRERAEEVPALHPRSESTSRSAMPSTPRAPAPNKAIRKNKPVIEPTIWDEEQEYLSKHGLRMFSAEEYMAEIGSPYESAFPAIY